MEQQQEETASKIYQYAFKLRDQGKTKDEIKQDLIMHGIDESTAEAISGNIEEHYANYTNIKKKTAEKNILYGGLWCAGGIIITAVTYSAASDDGGHYFIAWGAIIFGAIQFFRGVSQRM